MPLTWAKPGDGYQKTSDGRYSVCRVTVMGKPQYEAFRCSGGITGAMFLQAFPFADGDEAGKRAAYAQAKARCQQDAGPDPVPVPVAMPSRAAAPALQGALL